MRTDPTTERTAPIYTIGLAQMLQLSLEELRQVTIAPVDLALYEIRRLPAAARAWIMRRFTCRL